jgi:hypothetical protein
MSDFFAIGLFFVIEGILFAAFPFGAKRAIAASAWSPRWSVSSLSGWCRTKKRNRKNGTHFGSLFRPNPAPNCTARLVIALPLV